LRAHRTLQVERLMGAIGLQGVVCGNHVRTKIQDRAAPCPLDHVNRVFHARAPNRLWLVDFTYVLELDGLHLRRLRHRRLRPPDCPLVRLTHG
jgi:transposase InsO family protein